MFCFLLLLLVDVCCFFVVVVCIVFESVSVFLLPNSCVRVSVYECILLRLSFSFTYVVLFDFPLFLSFFLSSVFFVSVFIMFFLFQFILSIVSFFFFSFVICSVLYRSLNSICCNYSAVFFKCVAVFSIKRLVCVCVFFHRFFCMRVFCF